MLREIWEVRSRLEIENCVKDLALFNLGIDSKHRGCDFVRLGVRDVAHGEHFVRRATFLQQKNGQPVRLEITKEARDALPAWIAKKSLPPRISFFRDRGVSWP